MFEITKLIFLLRSLLLMGAGGFLFISPCLAQKAPFFTTGTAFSFPYVSLEARFQNVQSVKSQSFVQITAMANTCGTLQVPNRNFLYPFSVEKDSTLLIALPQDTFYADTLSDVGIMINATMPVQVVFAADVGIWDSSYAQSGSLGDSLSTEATPMTPIKMAGTDYILNVTDIQAQILPYNRYMGLWAYSLFDNTHIKIDLSNVRGNLLPKDTLVDLIYKEGECFYTYMESIPLFLNEERGYSGSILTSVNQKPFSVFAGRTDLLFGKCIDFSPFNSIGLTGEVFEQSKPIEYGDTLYAVAQIKDHYPNIYSILALEDSTIVKLNGNVLGTINKTYQIDTCFDGEAVITSNRPLLLTLTRSSFASNDPSLQPNSSTVSSFSITLPGSAELMKRSVLKPFSENYNNTYVVALFTKSVDTSNFTLDKQALPLGSWQPFAARPGWAWAQIEVSDKTHILESTGEGFIGYHYSYAKKKPNYYYYPSYGYCLIESKSVAEDSLYFYIKTKNTAKEKFSDFNENICAGDTIQLYPNAARHTSWLWNFGDGNDTLQLIKNENGKSIFHSYSQPGQYWLTVTDTSGCTAGDSLRIVVLASPTASFSYSVFETCDKGNKVELYNSSTGANSYTWLLPDGTTSSEESPSFYYHSLEPFEVSLIAKAHNCESPAITETINPSGESFDGDKLPNFFTPNNDGINDCFGIVNASGSYEECFELSIFNRWGRVVWSTADPNDCWNGMVDGTPVSEGTYFYVLKLASSEYKGHLYLSR